ncbi:hypothetical protein DO021_20485 [Desulfobacter hydrogenophilus]|uniref:Uncharacterized protein n=1 Tax=Desulfobacter hydrogenophilus TaxID=2291 RepID=A0A328F6J7_9BACT|nr:hypothetical protein [Desulfobacter hydrogenophilus]NDY74251.1 hypothetical protein [Desulfobacter hydrogenophilus]QBH14573.1 hypothetical protein EYB58_17560 [Desulfobacter hydrogenophilus]RAM00174.1 hypothetical protein DO021_20485 [Desulfobacter hydrogenophilus]
MSIENDVLELEEILTELESARETIDDLSLVSFTLEKDTYWDCLDLNLSIWGGDPERGCPIFETPVDAEVLLHEDKRVEGLSIHKISALFDEALLETIRAKGIPVFFNQGDKTEVRIDLSDPGNEVLLPMIR